MTAGSWMDREAKLVGSSGIDRKAVRPPTPTGPGWMAIRLDPRHSWLLRIPDCDRSKRYLAEPRGPGATTRGDKDRIVALQRKPHLDVHGVVCASVGAGDGDGAYVNVTDRLVERPRAGTAATE